MSNLYEALQSKLRMADLQGVWYRTPMDIGLTQWHFTLQQNSVPPLPKKTKTKQKKTPTNFKCQLLSTFLRINSILMWKVCKEVFQVNGLIPVIPDAPSTEQQELFTQKLHQCCVIFDFLDSVTDLKSKEIKRATLNELVEYVSTNRGVLVESSYPEITDMVSILGVLVKWRRTWIQSRLKHRWPAWYGFVMMLQMPPNSLPRCYSDSRAILATVTTKV